MLLKNSHSGIDSKEWKTFPLHYQSLFSFLFYYLNFNAKHFKFELWKELQNNNKLLEPDLSNWVYLEITWRLLLKASKKVYEVMLFDMQKYVYSESVFSEIKTKC